MRNNSNIENKDSISGPTKEKLGGALVITCKEMEVISVGDAQVTVRQIDRGSVRLAFRAPASCRIDRLGILDPWTNEILTRKDNVK